MSEKNGVDLAAIYQAIIAISSDLQALKLGHDILITEWQESVRLLQQRSA